MRQSQSPSRRIGRATRPASFRPHLECLEERLQPSRFAPFDPFLASLDDVFSDSPFAPRPPDHQSVQPVDQASSSDHAHGAGADAAGLNNGGSLSTSSPAPGAGVQSGTRGDNPQALLAAASRLQSGTGAAVAPTGGIGPSAPYPPQFQFLGTLQGTALTLGPLQPLVLVGDGPIRIACQSLPGFPPPLGSPEPPINFWSSYLSNPFTVNTMEQGRAVATDAQGNVYVAGVTGRCNNMISMPDNYGFVAKVSPDGSQLLWFNYFRETDSTDAWCNGVTVDPAGTHVYVTGGDRDQNTENTDLTVRELDAVTGGILQTYTLDNGLQNSGNGIKLVNNAVYVTGTVTTDPFMTTSLIVLKLDPFTLAPDPNFGGVIYGTTSTGNSIAVNPATGDVFVGGSIVLPNESNLQMLTLKVDGATGRQIDWAASRDSGDNEISTNYGVALAQEASGLEVYYTGNVYFSPFFGSPALTVGKLDDLGTSFNFTWGGTQVWSAITGAGIGVDSGHAYVTATYEAANSPPDTDTGVLTFGTGGDTLTNVFHFGSVQNPATMPDQAGGLDLSHDAMGHVVVSDTGTTDSGDFRVTVGVFQPYYGPPGRYTSDAFVAKITYV
jgi:hypothetical protein